jgi:Zn finger protein HypA/HybF involved in hydrogenase expression
MPFGFIWKCNKCEYSVTTSGLYFYFVDKTGLRKRYGHLGRSEEAKESGISGFTVEWYCSKCHSLREAVVLQFDHPQNGPVAAFMEYWNNLKSENKDFEIVCPKCGAELFDDLKGFPCPKCEKGKFKEDGRFMS